MDVDRSIVSALYSLNRCISSSPLQAQATVDTDAKLNEKIHKIVDPVMTKLLETEYPDFDAVSELTADLVSMGSEAVNDAVIADMMTSLTNCCSASPAPPTTQPAPSQTLPMSPLATPADAAAAATTQPRPPSATQPPSAIRPLSTRPPRSARTRPNSAMWRATIVPTKTDVDESGKSAATHLQEIEQKLQALKKQQVTLQAELSNKPALEFAETHELFQDFVGELWAELPNPKVSVGNVLESIRKIEEQYGSDLEKVVSELTTIRTNLNKSRSSISDEKLSQLVSKLDVALDKKITSWSGAVDARKQLAELRTLEPKRSQFKAAAAHVEEWDKIKITNYLEDCSQNRIPRFELTATVNCNTLVAKMKATELFGQPSRGTEKTKEFNYILGHLTTKTEAGRCYAAAAAVALTLLEDPAITAHVELAGTKAFNHAFIVVGRANYDPNNPNNGINDLDGWGPEAFVIDVWQANQKIGFEDHPLILEPKSWYYGKESIRPTKSFPNGSLVSTQMWKAEDRVADREHLREVIHRFEEDRAV